MKHSEEFWNKNISRIANEYYHTSITLRELAEENDCSVSTITVRLRKNGYGPIPNRSELRKNALISVDVNFFDSIDTEEKAYYLGLIATDGHVSKNGVLMFAFQESDASILYKFKNALKCEHPISFKNGYVYLNIGCKRLCDKLIDMGLNNNKSKWFDFNKLKSYVPNNLFHHFIRGMFDGDGSIRYYKYLYFKKHSYHFGFTGIKDTVVFFHEYFNLGTKIVEEGNDIFTCVSDNRAKILEAKDILYKEATVFIDRKKETFDQIQIICANEM